MEESFSAGKKVIYYDSEGFFKITDYVFNDSDFVARNYVELERIVQKIVNENKYSNAEKIKNIKNNYFINSDEFDGFQLIKKEIKQIYNGLN